MSVIVFFFLFFFLFFLLASSNPVLFTDLSLSLGLFKPGPQKLWYIGIWYKEDPKRTNVWVGNKDKPLTTPVGTLKFDVNNLGLFNQDNVLVWPINVTELSVLTSPVMAELLDNGNFVIKESNDPGRYLWESFDYPTDTLVPEMKLKISYRASGLDDPLTVLKSWKSSDDPSKGDFWFRIEQDQKVLETWTTQQRMDTWNGYQFGDMPPIFELKDDYFVMKALPNDSSYLRFTMKETGFYKLYSWNSKAKEWNLFWSIEEHSCYPDEFSESCGSFSFCYEQTCKCIKGFSSKLEHSSNGCLRRTVLNCGEDEFVKLQNMKLPISSFSFYDDDPDCKQSCLRDCLCTAFAVVEVHKGEHHCMLWVGEIEDMRNYTFGGQDLYVKLAAKDLGSSIFLFSLCFPIIFKLTGI